ncbi:hypothetical protein PY95_00380 [Lacticaseibacillus rhamnosus]|uniref:hypothetical protein n=1 Tax=Lacticaseibacillus rhamnosus TaxID=47715 RepID=UPI00065AA604|nr:hypothetical protein [Lacticaseibacillus rhamnosus]KMO48735.1 hypothetical protein PY95_00380 [Lacticaseibacillus rhamnosus]OAU07660.1 hypothetical protein PY72_00380 [Lacticaseibacillus rhamnosus]
MSITPTNQTPYPIIDYLGRPIQLQLFVTYRLRVKNGYILALRRNQHQQALPNLLVKHAS